MSRNLSIVECFDAAAAKAYLKRSRIEFILWVVSFAVFAAISIALFSVYGTNVAADRELYLWFAVAFIVVDVGGFVGSVVSILRYHHASRTVYDSAEYIREVAKSRAEVATATLDEDVSNKVFEAQGFYFSDIDTPYQMRIIGEDRFSSNYQTSILYLDGKHLNYKSAVFSLVGQEERILHGSIPFDIIVSVGVIKANGIDLFCPQLKVVFGSQCMLFALDDREDYREAVARLAECVK